MQPGEPKDYLDWTFYVDSKDRLIHSEVFSIRVCDPNIKRVVVVYSK